MRVLDLGAGAGDMSFVVAEVVGPSGEVVGIERGPEAVAEEFAINQAVFAHPALTCAWGSV
jgi:tRNA A58 N-methylase Trm61